MSGVEESDDTMMFCAACGTAEGGDVKLKKCNACKSVRYCGVNCQKEHRPQHKRKCKKRAAELRDEILFKQPESSHLGDCPICCLPLPIDNDKFIMMSCCCKKICNGCAYANQMRELEMKLLPKCPFCRHSAPESEEEAVKNLQKRFEANDPVAILEMGLRRHTNGDYDSAFEYWKKAAALGNIFAHHNLSHMYRTGLGVEKDKKKEVYHSEQAAIGGDIIARYNLGCVEEEHGRMDRAVKHWIINAKLGDDNALEVLKNKYRAGFVGKEDFAAALRAHQAAVDATKSSQRVAAEESNTLTPLIKF
ncbi:zf-MYND and TPR domain-containing protein [Skeletonema marinoi]|uniref:Zf-MYND and TPR domain-containing protein n=1 Tax=Skeletonema marinoi TaxID=267567 RepID=A0AAD8YIM0_9STRA|nr:zf-MYND and TPR domain-containing protein [Skeletonema marinoi]